MRSGADSGAAPARSPRDADRSAVYDAEALVRRLLDRAAEHPTVDLAGSTIALPVERRFGSIDSVQNYVDLVLAHPEVRRHWPDAGPVRVRSRRGSSQAHYEPGGVIAVPDRAGSVRGTAWAMRELVVLHELAHHLGATDEPWHGREFRSRFIELATLLIGPEAGLLLRIGFADVGLTG